MSVARTTEISATSEKGFDDAVRQGLARATKTLDNVRGAWVKEQKVKLNSGGEISEYKVDLKVTFVLND